MPDLDVRQETGLWTPVEEPSPEMAVPTPSPTPASASPTGEVVRRLGETARMDHALAPPATTPASFLSRPAYAMAANTPQKARMVLDLQQRYGNAYTQQVMTLVQPMPAAPATVAPEDEAPSDAPAAPAEPAIPATPAVSAAPAMSAAPAVPSTPTQVPAPPSAPAVVKPEASPMPEAAKPEVPPIPAVAEAAPQPLVAAPLEPEAPPPAEAVAVPPEAAMAPLAAEPESPAPEVDVSVEAEVAEEETLAETPAVPEGETEVSAAEAAAVEEAEAEAESTEEAAPEAAPAEGAAEGEAPAEGDAGAAAGDRAPASPEEDPAFQAVVKRSTGVAKEQRAHAPASDKAAAAQGAASGPPNEVASMAAGAQVGEMDTQEPQAFDRESFKAALLEKIAKTAPRNLKEADDFKDSGKLDAVKRDMTATVGEKKAQAQGNIAEATQAPPDTTGIEPKPVTPLEPTDAGPPPADLGAAAAAPKPKTDSEISLQEDSDSLDQKMQENEITETQLENANEPGFQAAVDSKKTAQTDAQERPLAYRQEEQGMVAEAKTTAVGSAETQLTTMHRTRSSLLEQVATGQVDTKSQDELKRVEVANHIEAIYQRTKANVEARLARLDEDVNQAFDTGSAQAQQAFENHVETRMDAYKDERYSGLRGKGRWIRDKFKGLPNAVNVFYEEGRNLYLSVMDGVLNNIAIIVETGLNDAKAEIALGKQDVQTYVDSLPVDLQDVGQQAADKIQSQFDDLEQQVNDKQGELVDALAKKYHDNLQKLDARIEEMKAANRGLIDKALGAIVGVIKTILALKDMLFNVLARAAAVIGTIISDPIGFLGNLVSGVMMGLENFMANLGQHLKKGLMEWLFGALGEAGIEMPDSFDFKGILSLILQILGLTYANIRARAVNIVGEAVVKRIEQTVEIFKVLMTEGPAGLWNMIQEQVGNLKDMILDGIESFIKEKVLIAGITWIISLLNPAAAFIKACKAIYDIVMFFVQRGSQILALVNAVLDSVTAIAQGALGAAAAAVENALAKAIPVAIAFLASLLGLGGISEKIRAIIEKVRAPVNRAIDWVINKAVQLVKAAGKLLRGEKDKEQNQDKMSKDLRPDERTEQQKQDAVNAAIYESQKLMEQPGESTKAVEADLPAIQSEYRLESLQLMQTDQGKYYVEAVLNPRGKTEEERLLSDEERARLDEVARSAARIIKSDPRARAVWDADPAQYIRERVAGEATERVGEITLERYAQQQGYSIIYSVSIELYDENDETVVQHQVEIDALLIGPQSVVQEIVDAKFDYDRVSPAHELSKLDTYYDPRLRDISPQKARQFGGGGVRGVDVSNVRSIGVVARGLKMTLAEFQDRYPRRQTIAVNAVGLSTVPENQPDVPSIVPGRLTIGTMAALTQDAFIRLIQDAINRHL